MPDKIALSDSERKALEALSLYRNKASTSAIGEQIWGRTSRKAQDWCRPAGRLLHRMLKRGLIFKIFDVGRGNTTWSATDLGRHLYANTLYANTLYATSVTTASIGQAHQPRSKHA